METTNPPYRSGKVAIAAALSIALVLVAGSVRLSQHVAASRAVPEEPGQVVAQHAPSRITEIDTDGDGTPDWQELLSGRDPDSAADGEDVLAQKPATALLATTLQTQQAGADPAAAQLFDAQLTHIMERITAFAPYVIADLRIVSDTSARRSAQYREDMRHIMAPFLTIEGAEFELYGVYIQNRDPAILEDLRARALIYERTAREALAISVPSDAASIHLDAVNSLAYYAIVLRALADTAEDPLAALLLLDTYNEAENALVTNFNRLGEYYNEKTGRVSSL